MKSLVVSVRFVRLGLLLFHYVQLFRTWPTVYASIFCFHKYPICRVIKDLLIECDLSLDLDCFRV